MKTIKPKLTRILPALASLSDYEKLSQEYMSPYAWAYIQGGSGDEQSVRNNRQAFERYTLLPNLLAACSDGHTRQQILGHELAHPIVLAPLAYQKLVHPKGEIETAQAAEATDSLMVSSTFASVEMEEIVEHNRGHNWFQLYFQHSREITLHLIERAQAAGFTALMLTVDAPIQSASRRVMRTAQHLPESVCAENLRAYPVPETKPLGENDSPIFQGVMQTAPNLSDVEWLLANTRLPVIVKGVLRPTDATTLKDMGVAGLVVSNHGGRALDAAPASIDCIAGVRESVGEGYPLLLDSGVRSGYDILKAIALGADAVMIGRPQVHALSIAGALGVAHMLKLLCDELAVAMALAGCPTLEAVKSLAIHRR